LTRRFVISNLEYRFPIVFDLNYQGRHKPCKLHYHQSCGSKEQFRKGDIIKVWNANRSGFLQLHL
jgi:hypothetical protein